MGKVITGVLGGWDSYTSKEFLVGAGQTNYDVWTSQSCFASPAERVIIRTDADITIRLSNSATALATVFDAITVTAAEGFDTAGITSNILNVYITTVGAANVKLLRVPGSGN